MCMCLYWLPTGSKRASSDEKDEFEVREGGVEMSAAAMTEEQREFLKWFYRTEDRK